MDISLTPREQEFLLHTARDAIQERLGVAREPERDPAEATATLQAPCGAFVTLHKNGRLRGCIGHITASRPLVETIREVAVSSALEDPRFPAVTADEASALHIEISVLSPFRRIRDVAEIRVGTHGILMRRGYHSGLLLPQVAVEQGWDRETFLEHTCMKAGIAKGAWRDGETEIEIFSAIVFAEEKK